MPEMMGQLYSGMDQYGCANQYRAINLGLRRLNSAGPERKYLLGKIIFINISTYLRDFEYRPG